MKGGTLKKDVGKSLWKCIVAGTGMMLDHGTAMKVRQKKTVFRDDLYNNLPFMSHVKSWEEQRSKKEVEYGVAIGEKQRNTRQHKEVLIHLT